MFGLSNSCRALKLRSAVYRLRRAWHRRTSGLPAADRHRTGFYEQAWRSAAGELGASVTQLDGPILEISLGGRSVRVCRNDTPLDDPVTLQIAGNKPLVYRRLAACHVPTPAHLRFSLSSLGKAVAFLKERGGPCVVKPSCDTGAGHGVTTAVTAERALVRAAALAASYRDDLLIEQQVPGEVYRLLYLDGVLLDAVLRRSPSVVGDGLSTVAELVLAANSDRLVRGAEVGQTLLTVDLEMRATLAAQGLTLNSIPNRDRVVRLKTVSNENSSQENEAAATCLCSEIIETGRRAAASVGVRLAGIDVLTTDPRRPLEETGGVVLEVNTTPGFYYHYHRIGTPFAAAVPVLRRLLHLDDERQRTPCFQAESAFPSFNRGDFSWSRCSSSIPPITPTTMPRTGSLISAAH